MIDVMKKSYGANMIVNDLAHACSTKSSAEVTKDFIKASSYILRASIKGGDAKSSGATGSAPVLKKSASKREPALWDTKQFAVGQNLSQTTYYNVKGIAGDRITVEDQHGGLMHVSKDIVEKMVSGTHFSREISMNMTGLAELLETFSDTIFTVSFHKQPTVEGALANLESTSFKDLKDQKKVAALSKLLTQGELCQITGHLVKVENNLGRSTVIDLTAKGDNKFRQVDHRTIEWLVFKNVKYVLKKGGKKEADDGEEKKKGEPLWDYSKLFVGNWFSTTAYFQVKAIKGDEVITMCDGKEVTVSRDILEHEMHNACVYAKEEKLALTKVVKILKEANSVAFTICFNTKVDEKQVSERLQSLAEKDFKDKKALAKELLTGSEKTIVGRKTKTEGKLGRSLVLGLPANNFVSVDHRTINWLIFKNVKYIVN